MASPKRSNKKKQNTQPAAPIAEPSILARGMVQGVIVAIAAIVLYANTFDHEFVLDDTIVVSQNRFVQQSGIKGIVNIFSHGYLYGFNERNDQSYRPLTLASLALEKQWFGCKAGGHHVFNVLYYALASVILLLFLRRILSTHEMLPFVITLLFVAHPIHTEVVANIKSRDEALSFLFLIASLWALLKSVDVPKRSWFVLSALCALCATLAKETGVTVFVLAPLTLYFFTELSWKAIAKRCLPLVGVALFYFAVRYAVLDDIAFDQQMFVINNALAGANGFMARLAGAIAILGFYLRLLVIPHPLSYDYSFNQLPVATWSSMETIVSVVIWIALIAFAVWGFFRKQLSSYAISFFVVSIALVANILTLVGATAAERFLFTPSLGFCIVLGVLGFQLFRRIPEPWVKRLAWGATTLVLVLYSAKTITRNRVWHDQLSLFSSGLETAPNSARVHNNYASAVRDHANKGNLSDRARLLPQAIASFRRAVEIHPEYADAWNNLGAAYSMVGDKANAKTAFQEAIKQDSKLENALINLGFLHYEQGSVDQAEPLLQRAVELYPNSAEALGGMGMIFHRRGDLQKALQYYERSVERSPSQVDNLIQLYEQLGLHDKAALYRQRRDGYRRFMGQMKN